jgi:membrane-associated protease RseP (regulator of RpoE activity)
LSGEHSESRWSKNVKFQFIFILLESERAALLIKKISKSKLNTLFGYLGIPVFVGLALVAFYLILGSLAADLFNPVAREAAGSVPLQAYLLIPGFNPFVPVVYGLIGIVVAVTVHEASHGVVAWREGVKVEGAGVVLLLFIPLGAYVRPSENELNSKSFKQKIDVFTAGITANLILAAVTLLLLIFVVMQTVTVPAGASSGVAVYSVNNGSPAYHAGLKTGDVIVSMNGYQITNTTVLSRLEASVFRPGQNVSIQLSNGTVTHAVMGQDPYNKSVAILGITTFDAAQALATWRHPSNLLLYFVPATIEATPLNPTTAMFYNSYLPGWQIIGNTLFWLWWINVNLAIFNALPAFALDGGQVIKEVFTKLFGPGARAETATRLVTATVFSLIFMLVILPRIL